MNGLLPGRIGDGPGRGARRRHGRPRGRPGRRDRGRSRCAVTAGRRSSAGSRLRAVAGLVVRLRGDGPGRRRHAARALTVALLPLLLVGALVRRPHGLLLGVLLEALALALVECLGAPSTPRHEGRCATRPTPGRRTRRSRAARRTTTGARRRSAVRCPAREADRYEALGRLAVLGAQLDEAAEHRVPDRRPDLLAGDRPCGVVVDRGAVAGRVGPDPPSTVTSPDGRLRARRPGSRPGSRWRIQPRSTSSAGRRRSPAGRPRRSRTRRRGCGSGPGRSRRRRTRPSR